MAYDTTGKRRRTENLAGQATATAWNCCHKITFDFPFDDIDNWRSSLERRGQSAEYVAYNLNQYTSIEQSEQLVLRSFSEGGSNNFSPLYDADGVTTKYAYDAAGRLVKEGNKTYSYGYLDKVLSVTEGAKTYAYDYHVDGQLARADYAGGRTEDFAWDGLALIRRGDERFVNEPHVGGGNPVVSSKGTTYFNDLLGTTVGAKAKGKYSAAALTAFGEDISAPGSKHQAPSTFFTGKPEVAGLGHAFLFRNYRAGLAKWHTADPMGYPDGWNQLAYCGNGVIDAVDWLGAREFRLKKGKTNVKDVPCGGWIDNGDGREYQWWLETWNDVYDIFEMEESDWEKWLGRLGLGAEVIGGAITALGIAVASGPLGWAGIVAVLAGIGIEVRERQLMDSQPADLKVVMEGFIDPELQMKSFIKWRVKE